MIGHPTWKLTTWRPIMSVPPVLDGRELAAVIGMDYESLMSLHRAGIIPSIKTSHRVYFNLDRVIEALRKKTAGRYTPELEGVSA
jgi:hypothetical protein